MLYDKFDSFALKLGYARSEEDHNVYIKVIDDQLLIIVLYLDDMFISNNTTMIRELKTQFSSTFDMKDLGVSRYILGKKISRD